MLLVLYVDYGMHFNVLALIRPRFDCLIVLIPKFSSVENSVSMAPLFLFLNISLISLKVEQELLCFPSFSLTSCFSFFYSSFSSSSSIYLLFLSLPRSNRFSKKLKPHDYDLVRIGETGEIQESLLTTKKGWFRIYVRVSLSS